MSRPIRVYFVDDDPAELWSAGDTADDLGEDGLGMHRLRLDHFDDAIVAIQDPYGRGLIRRLGDETPPGFSDAELDEYLDSRKDDDA